MTPALPRWLRWSLPKLGAAIWLAFFAGLTLTNWREVMVSADGDPSLHWRIGDWMIKHGRVLRAEQFSHTRLDAPLISKEWLSEVLFAAAGNAFGWAGAVALAAGFIATTLWLLHRRLRGEGCELLLATALVLVAARAGTSHWAARPHVVTHLLTVVFAWQLARFERGELPVRTLFAWLPALMLLWTNLHGAFFTGFVILGLYWLATLFELARDWRGERRAPLDRLRALTLLGLACAAASLVNPNGWQLHAQVIEFLRTPLLAGFTNEFRSPDFHSGAAGGLVLVLALVGWLLLVVRPKLRASEFLLLGAWGYFALYSVRNIPIFGLVAVPAIAPHLQAWLQSREPSRWLALYHRLSERLTRLDERVGGRAFLGAGIALVAMLTLVPAALGWSFGVPTRILPDRFPVAATHWLQQHPKSVKGEMFNDYGWGGYLMLCLPERKVFVDGRNDFYGPGLIGEFALANRAQPGWDNVLAKYDVGWTILPVKHPLNSILALLPQQWQEVYRDDVALIYSRRHEGAHQRVVKPQSMGRW